MDPVEVILESVINTVFLCGIFLVLAIVHQKLTGS